MGTINLGLDKYDRETIHQLCADDQLNGIVVGDLFCGRRMFQGGISEQIVSMEAIIQSGKSVVYQMPVYVTSRNVEEVRSVLEFLKSSAQDVKVIVHDMGMAEELKREFHDFHVIWGRLGRARKEGHSSAFLELLSGENFYGIELTDAVKSRDFHVGNLHPCFVYGNMHYSTFGRQCMNRYQKLGCSRESCISGEYSMKDDSSEYTMTLNGYVLGERFVYDSGMIGNFRSVPSSELMVYARTIGEYRQMGDLHLA